MLNLEGDLGIQVGGHNLNNLRHADDTVLLPKNKEDLQQLLDIVEEESRKKGLELNSKSTQVMVVSGSNERPQTNIFINVNKFKQRNKIKFNIKRWTQLHSNCIKNRSSKKEFPENEINTNKKPHLDSHKKKSPVVLC